MQRRGMQNEWKKPSFVEIAMNAEIGSYQPDFEEAPRADEDPEAPEEEA
jgi:hypothetical protein